MSEAIVFENGPRDGEEAFIPEPVDVVRFCKLLLPKGVTPLTMEPGREYGYGYIEYRRTKRMNHHGCTVYQLDA